ncbi:MAG: class B sortase [Clostridia bacterium]|nr:class B sortase [Clostridia bacterium]
MAGFSRKNARADGNDTENHYSFLRENENNPYQNVFVDSLERVTQDDLGEEPEKPKRSFGDIVFQVLQKLILVGAAVAFIVAGVHIGYRMYAYQQAEDIYSSLVDSVFSTDRNSESVIPYALQSPLTPLLAQVNTERKTEDNNPQGTASETNELFQNMKRQLSILRRSYPEIVGWIRMEGSTEINYPIVQTSDNDYYLNHSYDGTYNPSGAIFLDCVNNAQIGTNRHAIIYGHNMMVGSPMFANLLYFRYSSYLKDNHTIEVYTPEALYIYEVFAAYEADGWYVAGENHPWKLDFNYSNEEFLDWIAYIRRRSGIRTDVEITETSRILTLSTCTNVNDGRFVVHAYLSDVITR